VALYHKVRLLGSVGIQPGARLHRAGKRHGTIACRCNRSTGARRNVPLDSPPAIPTEVPMRLIGLAVVLV
jgi:hypothetical protein